MDEQLCGRTRLLALCGYLVQCGLMLAFMLGLISESGFDLGQLVLPVGLVVRTAFPYLVLVIMVQAFQKSRLATVPLQLALWLIAWGGAFAGWGILRGPGDALIGIAFITIPGLQLLVVLVASFVGYLIHGWDVAQMERAEREDRALHAPRAIPPPPADTNPQSLPQVSNPSPAEQTKKAEHYDWTLRVIISGCLAQCVLWLVSAVSTESGVVLALPWLLPWTAFPCIVLAAAARSCRTTPRAAVILLVAAVVNALVGLVSNAMGLFGKPGAFASIVYISAPTCQLLFVLAAAAIAWLLQVFSPGRSTPAPPPID